MNRDVSSLTGWTVSDETKEKIRKSLKGKKRPDCVVEKMRQSLKNYEWSDEHKKKRRDGLLKFYQDTPPEMRLQWKKNISESLKGKKVKESTKEKLSRINSKLTDDEVLEIYNLINQNVRYKLISEKYNISLSQITSIKQKKTYKWLWN
jgi:DNA-binding protein Fis